MDGGNAVNLIAQLSGSQAIGRIDTTAGQGTITRVDGSVVPADKGTPVFQGDTVETAKGGKVGIIFADNTTFALGENGQMRMDEMVYNPQSKAGSLGLSMLKGAFVMVTGEIAPSSTDAMTIRTPVGTIGIRGTKIAGNLDISQGLVLSLLPDPVGRPAAVVVSNAAGTQFITEANTGLQISSYNSAPTAPQPMNSLPGAGALADVLAQVLAFVDGMVGDQIVQAIQQVADAQAAERAAAVRDTTAQANTQAQTVETGVPNKIIVTEFETKLVDLLDPQIELTTVAPIYNSPSSTPIAVRPNNSLQNEPGTTVPGSTGPTTLTGSNLIGTDRDELLIGTAGNDVIKGMGGNDTILGITGYDTIDGGNGNDLIQATQPAYIIDGSAKVVTSPTLNIDGGLGNDTLTLKILPDEGGESGEIFGSIDATIISVEKLFLDVTALNNGTLGLYDNAEAAKLGEINLIGTTSHIHVEMSGDGFKLNASALKGSNDFSGSMGNDTIIAGIGNDTIDGGGGADNINAGAGNDTIYLNDSSYDSTVNGGAGNDRIEITWDGEGSPANGINIDGGAGVDTLDLNNGSGFEGYIGPSANITGIDVIEISAASSGVADFAFDFSGAGWGNADQNGDGVLGDLRIAVKGNLGSLVVDAHTASKGSIIDAHDYNIGDIDVTAGSGNDTLILSSLGAGAGVVQGGAGHDLMLVGNLASNGMIDGGNGNDTLIVSGGQTYTGINLGAGTDVVRAIMNDAAVSSFGLGAGSSGIDRLEIYANTDNIGAASVTIDNGVIASGATLTIQGYGHDGNIDFYDAGKFAGYGDVKSSHADLDVISFGVNINASPVTGGNIYIAGGFGGNDTIIGSQGNDTIYAGDGNDRVTSGGGIDSIYGGLGDDSLTLHLGGGRLDGGDGNDTLIAGTSGMTGNVTLIGGAGDDSITGGSHAVLVEGGIGNDTISLRSSATVYAGDGNDTVTASSAGAPNIDLGNGNDYLAISSGVTAFTVTGGAGNDTINVSSLSSAPGLIYGGDGNDSVRAGLGNDTIYTGTGTDLISGNDGNDKIYVQGSGTIFGGEGNDTINLSGTTSTDTLMISGGNGADYFEGSTNANVTFRYFEPMEGGDVFALGAFNAATMQIEVSELDFPGYGTVIELSGASWNDALMADGNGALVLFTNTTTGTKQLYADYNGNGAGYSYMVVDFGTNAVTKADIQFTDYS